MTEPQPDQAVAVEPKVTCHSCGGLNLSCPEGCGRNQATGELDGSRCNCQLCQAKGPAMNTQPPEASALAAAIMSEVFLRAQPDRGDVFSWLDDHIQAIVESALRASQPQSAGDAGERDISEQIDAAYSRWTQIMGGDHPPCIVFGAGYCAGLDVARISTPGDLCPRTVEAAARVADNVAGEFETEAATFGDAVPVNAVAASVAHSIAHYVRSLATPKPDASDGSAESLQTQLERANAEIARLTWILYGGTPPYQPSSDKL